MFRRRDQGVVEGVRGGHLIPQERVAIFVQPWGIAVIDLGQGVRVALTQRKCQALIVESIDGWPAGHEILPWNVLWAPSPGIRSCGTPHKGLRFTGSSH